MTTPNPWLETFIVNSGYAQPSFQTNSAIIGLANGGFVVTWADDDWNSTGSGNEWDIAAKIFDAEGNVVRDSYQLNSASGDIWISSVVPTHDGFAMLYYVTDEDGFGYSALAFERYDFSGNSIEYLDFGAFDYFDPRLTANLLPSVDTVFLNYTSSTYPTWDGDVFSRIVNSDGTLGAENVVANEAGTDEVIGSVATLSNGTFLTVYGIDGGSDTEVRFVIKDGGGNNVVTSSPTDGFAVDTVDTTGLEAGGFVIAYGLDGEILARVFDNAGNQTGSVTVTDDTLSNKDPAVIGLPDGSFVIAWEQSRDFIYAQRFDSNGIAIGSRFTVDSDTEKPIYDIDLGVTADGRVLFTWTVYDSFVDDFNYPGNQTDIRASIWDPRDSVIRMQDYAEEKPNFHTTNTVTTGLSGSTVLGTYRDESVAGKDGDDRIFGFGGVDAILGGDGNDLIEGGDGDDRLFGGNGDDRIDGGAGNDLIEGKLGDDDLFGGLGNDILRARDGDDVLDGGAGDDIAFGGFGSDLMRGGDGNDTLDGSAGEDFIQGEDGDDVLNGAGDRDTVFGGDGDDRVRGGGNNDLLYGDAGDDSMFGSAGNDLMFGGTGNDVLEGNTQSDELHGEDGNDILRGGDGFDTLFGGAGNDTLVGGNGQDILVGGLGTDVLRGNSQNDVFRFNDVYESTAAGSDLIDGFGGAGNPSGDIIDLSAMDAREAEAGHQSFVFLGVQTTADALSFGAGALWLEDSGMQTRIYGNVDGDTEIELIIRINDGNLVAASDYTSSDFWL